MTRIMDNKLNMVTGGDFDETAWDSWALYRKGLIDKRYGTADMVFHWVTNSAKVDAAWSKAGIRCLSKPISSNRYYKDGKEISHDLALYLLG